MIYCMINLPLFALSYFYNGWFWGQTSCQVFTAFRQINAVAEWISVAMIAVARCLTLTNARLASKLLSKVMRRLIIIFIWIYANLLAMPIWIFGTLGYNYKKGQCELLIDSLDFHLRAALATFGVVFPCLLILISYILIVRHVLIHGKYLKNQGTSNMKKIIAKREAKTTWTIFTICMCFFLFVGPFSIVTAIFDETFTDPKLQLGLFCLYWFQYSLNFFVYVARSGQYRRAFSYFLNKAWSRLKCHKNVSTTAIVCMTNDKQVRYF